MRSVVIAVVVAAFAPVALADGSGTLVGAVGPTAPKQAVVWLEGVPASAWALPKETTTLSQRGARFTPEFLVITVGQSVAMPNDDRITHNVFSVSATKKFDLGHYPQGESRTVKFERAGVVDLFCNIHENMHAVIVVVPSTFYALADASGAFTLSRVPPGHYKLSAYAVEGGTGSTEVTVTAGASTHVALNVK
jgi:plastocyanin